MTKKKTEKIDYKKTAEKLAAENVKLNGALLRERADAMNVRKQAESEKAKLGGFYKSLVVKELLPVIDNFERALKSQESGEMSHEEMLKGISAVNKQFVEVLIKLGVERIKTTGEHFDPELHEAVSHEEGDGEHDIVSEELQGGYKMGEEVLRHAVVRVKG